MPLNPSPPPADHSAMTSTDRDLAELRGALIFAGRRIRALHPTDRALPILRRVLRESPGRPSTRIAPGAARPGA